MSVVPPPTTATAAPRTPSTPPAPVASLSTLPLEIKAQIVALASAQDRVYRDRWDEPWNMTRYRAALPLVHDHLQNAWRGKSLSALGQTCRILNALANKYLFELAPSRSLDGDQLADIYFLLRILPRHSSHVLQVRLVDSNDDQLIRALALLPLLPNLRRLFLNGFAASRLFAGTAVLGGILEEVDQDSSAVLRCEPLKLIAPRLEHLELADFATTLDAVFILLHTTSLQSLIIRNTEIGGNDEVTLAEHLASLKSLRSLTLGDDDGLFLGAMWSRLKWKGPMKALHLHDLTLTSDVVAFVDTLAPALEHLTLDGRSFPAIPSGYFQSPFPSLLSLNLLHIHHANFEAIMVSLAGPRPTGESDSPGPTPPLQELRLALKAHKAFSADDAKSMLFITSLFPNLSLLDISYDSQPVPIYYQPILAPATDRGIIIPASAFTDPFIKRLPPVELQKPSQEFRIPKELKSRHGALKRAIDFASRRVDAMLRNRDLGEMEEAFEVLGGVWGLKLLEDD